MVIRCTIPGPPLGKGRPRVVRGGGHTFTPQQTVDWEGEAGMLMRLASRPHRLPFARQPLKLHVVAAAARPRDAKDLPPGPCPRMTKPDGDNVQKIVADALVKGGVILDDAHIVHWECQSIYTAKGEPPYVGITLELLGPEGIT